MSRRISFVLLFVLIAGALSLPAPTIAQDGGEGSPLPADYNGFRVQGRTLVAPDGEVVVPVGVNKMVIWTDRDGMPAFPEIAQTGASAVRIVWLMEGSATELDVAITNAINHDLIPLIDCHDTTGEWEVFPACVDFWVRPDVLAVIAKHEDYLLLNIANEADEGGLSDYEYRAGYEWAIKRLRAAGIRVPLIVDAPKWARNFEGLHKAAPYLMKVDPLQNVLFDIHIYHSQQEYGYKVGEYIADVLTGFAEENIPLIVGEFSNTAWQCKTGVPYLAVIETAHELGIGWFAWSWGPGNQDCAQMDMTADGTFAGLRDWGLEVATTDPNSIQNVAVRPQHILDQPEIEPGFAAPPPGEPAADLVIEAVAWEPEALAKGDNVTFSATITNQGTMPTDAPFRVQFEAKNEVVAWVDVTEPLESGATITVAASDGPDGDGFWNDIRVGNFVLIIWVDSEGAVPEVDDNNNVFSAYGTAYSTRQE